MSASRRRRWRRGPRASARARIFFFQAEDGIREIGVTGVQTCALPIYGIPAVPAELAEKTRPYMEFRTAGLQAWNPRTRGIAITTRFGNVPQVHEVARPGGDRRQVTFEADTIAGATYARRQGDVMVVQKDVGGSEFWQLYRLDNGRLALLTDGKSRNSINAWSHDGRWLAYTSTRRNGADNDIYIIDPRNPKSDRRVAELKGGGWSLRDFGQIGRASCRERV